jgi:glutathione S-transferase
MDSRRLIFFHAPGSRSTGVLILLEELGADHELRTLDLETDEQHGPEYLGINPMGKVPAIIHGHELVTEQVALFIYLSDLFTEHELAPPVDDLLRGPWLRWIALYGTCFEPAIVDRALKREPAPRRLSPYGEAAELLRMIDGQLAGGPWLLGERFLAVDVLWGNALSWATGNGLLEQTPHIDAYVERFEARPATRRVRAEDAARIEAQQLLASHAH